MEPALEFAFSHQLGPCSLGRISRARGSLWQKDLNLQALSWPVSDGVEQVPPVKAQPPYPATKQAGGKPVRIRLACIRGFEGRSWKLSNTLYAPERHDYIGEHSCRRPRKHQNRWCGTPVLLFKLLMEGFLSLAPFFIHSSYGISQRQMDHCFLISLPTNCATDIPCFSKEHLKSSVSLDKLYDPVNHLTPQKTSRASLLFILPLAADPG